MSFANNQVFGDDITVTYGSAVYPLGTERLVLGAQSGVGDQVWVFVYNSTGADYVAGQVLGAKLATTSLGTTIKTVAAATPSVKVVGFAQHVIPGTTTTTSSGVVTSGPYGWVLKKGIGSVLAGAGAITQDVSIVVDTVTAGAAMDNSVLGAAQKFDTTIGYAHTSAAAAALATCYVNVR
jgi:hypothetical protein